MSDDIFASTDDTPSRTLLAEWFVKAHSGDGAPWLLPYQAEALARYALDRGEGVSLMEAAAIPFTEPPRDDAWEIIGNDPTGENWAEHEDPARAFALVRRKLDLARSDGVQLKYKIWLSPAGR